MRRKSEVGLLRTRVVVEGGVGGAGHLPPVDTKITHVKIEFETHDYMTL